MKHGANVYKYAKRLNCNSNEIIDFSSNINFYQPEINIVTDNNMVVKYGDNSYKDLKKVIKKRYNINLEQMKLYNGATSAIFELFKVIKAKRVYLYAPLYGEYEQSISKKQKVIKINRFENLYKKPKKNSIVVFVNPATPDGKYYDFTRLFSLWNERKCTIVLDESFIEFEDLKYLKSQINFNKRLYIIQSFSKFYACAGVRIGAIFSHKSNIKNLKTSRWILSSFDVAFLTKRLKDEKFYKKSKKLHKKNKDELYNILIKSKLFDKVYDSNSNFFLTRSKQAKEIFKYLLYNKVLTRKCESFDFLSDNYLRFAVKDDTSHKKLKGYLKKFID